MSSKKWCFTEHTNPGLFYQNLETLFQNPDAQIKYICGQLEICPDTQKEHFQGYVQLKRDQRLSFVKKNISTTAHWESQKAPQNDTARNYCSKQETRKPETEFVEFGVYIKGRGERTDLSGFRDACRTRNVRQIIDEHPNELARFPRFMQLVKSVTRPADRTTAKEVILYVGEPGTGKTRKAKTENDDLFTLPVSNGTMWFDGYDQQTAVLFDDFGGRYSKLDLNSALQILDNWSTPQLPVKGGFIWLTADKLILTSNLHPRIWYEWENRENQYKALWRRFTQVIVFEHDGEQVELTPEDYFEDRDYWPTIAVNVENYRRN